MLEHKQAHDHLGREAAPAARAAQAMALAERLVRSHDDRLVGQHLVGVDHPVLVETVDLVGDQLVAEAELGAPRVDHIPFPARLAGASSRRSRW